MAGIEVAVRTSESRNSDSLLIGTFLRNYADTIVYVNDRIRFNIIKQKSIVGNNGESGGDHNYRK